MSTGLQLHWSLNGPCDIWPYPNGLNCMHLLIYPSVIHSYCPYIDTDDLVFQQMTPVYIISSVVVGLEPPHVNLLKLVLLDLIHLSQSMQL